MSKRLLLSKFKKKGITPDYLEYIRDQMQGGGQWNLHLSENTEQAMIDNGFIENDIETLFDSLSDILDFVDSLPVITTADIQKHEEQDKVTATQKHAVDTLEGALLDYAVAVALGYDKINLIDGVVMLGDPKEAGYYHPSTDWRIAGALLADNAIQVKTPVSLLSMSKWVANVLIRHSGHSSYIGSFANTPQIAICRCFVKMKLSSHIDLPVLEQVK